MKRLFCTLFLALAVRSFGTTVVTVNWAAAFDNGFALQDGTALAVGNEIRLGVFDFADATLNSDIQSLLAVGDMTGLAAHFTQFDVAHIGDAFPENLGTVPLNQRQGLFEKSSGGVTVNTGSTLFGKQLFMWVFKTTADNSPLGNFSNVTQTGLYSSSLSSWFFPSDSGLSESTSFDVTNLSNPAGTALSGNQRIPWGGFGTGTTPATGSPAFNLAIVPEPTSCSFAAVGLLLLGYRRKRG